MNKTILMTFIFLTSACASNEFKGESDTGASNGGTKAELQTDQAKPPKKDDQVEVDEKEESKEEIKDDKPILPDEAEEILAEDGELSDDDKKIVGCIEEWGSAEISKDALRGYRKLTSKNEGFSSSVLKDSKKTDKPRLVLVSAAATGFAGTRMELMNPNGWYCVDVKNVGFSGSDLMLHCDSELAGYSAENTGFSNAQESRVGC